MERKLSGGGSVGEKPIIAPLIDLCLVIFLLPEENIDPCFCFLFFA